MSVLGRYDALTARLVRAGDWVWPFALRAILAWEFWESGITKLRGENWFADIPWADWQKGFPWPFGSLPVDLNWFLATWAELVFALMLLLGLFTRLAAVSLVVVTAVAAAAVHWPAQWDSLPALWAGYAITSKDGAGNFKLALLFVVMLLPLVYHGGGKFSLDHVLVKRSGRGEAGPQPGPDWLAASLGCAVPGLAVVWVEPAWGITLLLLAAGLGIMSVVRPAA